MLNPYAPNPDESAPRPVRTVVGSTAVAAVALGIVAVVGMFRPTAPDGWRRDLITDGEGTRYVILDGRLHPVLNLASAKLILGKDFKKADVPDSTLESLRQSVGPAVGIPGAPEKLPRAADLDAKSWSLCSTMSSGPGAAGKTVIEIGYPPSSGILATPQALLVQDEAGQQYVITGGVKYRVQDRNVLVAFNAPALKARPVKSSWLSGLPAGDALGVPRVVGAFGAVVKRPSPAGFNRVGMFGRTVAPNGSTAYYLVSGDGLVSVSATAYELFQRDPRLAALKFTETFLAQSRISQAMLAPISPSISWPSDPPKLAAPSQDPAATVLCVAFDGKYDQQGRPQLTLSSSSALPHPLTSTDETSTAAGQADVMAVLAGHGVIAASRGADANLITDSGIRYPLVTGQSATSAAQLGYDAVVVSDVPQSWLSLLPAGPALDPAKAAQPGN
jgi:type VII secretion protein EccB